MTKKAKNPLAELQTKIDSGEVTTEQLHADLVKKVREKLEAKAKAKGLNLSKVDVI